jgi:hypothetical protein
MLFRALVLVVGLVGLVAACSSSTATNGTPTYQYEDKCNARCSALGCSTTCDQFSCSTGTCAGDCARLTDKLALACAQCLIEQSTAQSTAMNQSACATYRIGQSTDAACHAACGT